MGSTCSVSRDENDDELSGIEGVYYNENRSRVIYMSLNLEVKQWGQSVRRSYDIQLFAKLITPNQLRKMGVSRVTDTPIVIVDVYIKNITPAKFCSKRDLIRGDFRQPTIKWGKFKVNKSVPEFLPMAMCVGQYRVYAILHHDSPKESKIRINGKLFHDEITLETLCEDDNKSSSLEEMEEMISFLHHNCKSIPRTETADYSLDSGFRDSRNNSLFTGFASNKVSDGEVSVMKESRKNISSTGCNADGLSIVVQGSPSTLSSRSATAKAKKASFSDTDDDFLTENQHSLSSQDEWLSSIDFDGSQGVFMSLENIPKADDKNNVQRRDRHVIKCINECKADVKSERNKHKCRTKNSKEQVEDKTGQCQHYTSASNYPGKSCTDENRQQKFTFTTRDNSSSNGILRLTRFTEAETSSFKDKKPKIKAVTELNSYIKVPLAGGFDDYSITDNNTQCRGRSVSSPK